MQMSRQVDQGNKITRLKIRSMHIGKLTYDEYKKNGHITN